MESIYRWFLKNQQTSPVGLITSYPDDAVLRDQGFTYDEALAGIVFLKRQDTAAAKKIFDFFWANWDPAGFWTVYNSLYVGGAPLEYMKIMGPTAWVGIFALHYYAAVSDSKALDLALKTAQWIRSLPHKDGGVAMGVEIPWKNVYSVENNLDYYALLEGLLEAPISAVDRQWAEDEHKVLQEWFKTKAFDASAGFFKRSPIDQTQALDTNAWSFLVFGAKDLNKIFSIDIHDFTKRVEDSFQVQDDGSFGGEALSAKGFDFSNSHNAISAGRKGLKWVEGTGQMITAYNHLHDFYSSVHEDADTEKAAHYAARAAVFSGRNSENQVLNGDATGYVYTDRPGAKIWWDNPYWTASKGSAAASSAWVYFAENKINPFRP